MADEQSLTRQYVKDQKMMQLATSVDGQPWCCTVYYVADDALNLYWISKSTRRHSEEVTKNSKVAVAIPVQFVPGEKVVGVQLEGDASTIEDPAEAKTVITLYGQKFNHGQEWINDFVNGNNPHTLYKLVPRNFVLFDEANFPEDTRREWSPVS